MALRDLVPRHTRGYLWISFLVAVFLLMALSENGIFSDNILPNPVLIPKQNGQQYLNDARYDIPSNGLFLSVPSKAQSTAVATATPTAVGSEGTAEETRTRVKEVKETGKSEGKWEGMKGGKEEEEMSFNGLSPKDVVVLVKTGATSLWRRMPGHSKYSIPFFSNNAFELPLALHLSPRKNNH